MTDESPLLDMKFILGSMGTDILNAIAAGARTIISIRLASGCPEECVKGRLPVLIDLGLISKEFNEYLITERGIQFREIAALR